MSYNKIIQNAQYMPSDLALLLHFSWAVRESEIKKYFPESKLLSHIIFPPHDQRFPGIGRGKTKALVLFYTKSREWVSIEVCFFG